MYGKKESIIEEVGKKNIAKLINCKRIKKSSFIKNQEANGLLGNSRLNSSSSKIPLLYQILF